MVACAMIVVMMTVLKKMRWQDAGIILVLLFVVYSCNSPIREILSAKAAVHFIDSDTMGGNGISSGVGKMKYLVTAKGMMGFLYSLAGQLWYLTAATGLMFLWGIKAAITKIVGEKEHVLFYGFALLALAGMVCISAISTIGIMGLDLSKRVRLDYFFYGRYNECIIGIFLLLGLLCIAQAALNRKTIFCHGICTVLFLIMASGFAYKIKDAADYYVQSCNVFGTEYYRWFGEFRVGTCTVIAFVLSLLLLAGFCRKNDIRYRQAGTVLVGGICVLFFALTGLQGIRSFEMVEQRYTKQYAELFDYIKGLDADQIYVYGSYKAAADVQNRTVDKEVIRLCYGVAQIDDVETGNYLVLDENTAQEYGLEKLEVCYEYLDYLVCIK
jgi:hypothetical protein